MKTRKRTKTRKTKKYVGGNLSCEAGLWASPPFDPTKNIGKKANVNVEIYRQAEADMLNLLGVPCTGSKTHTWVNTELLNLPYMRDLFLTLTPNTQNEVLNKLRKSIFHRTYSLPRMTDLASHELMLQKIINLKKHLESLLPPHVEPEWRDDVLKKEIVRLQSEIDELVHHINADDAAQLYNLNLKNAELMFAKDELIRLFPNPLAAAAPEPVRDQYTIQEIKAAQEKEREQREADDKLKKNKLIQETAAKQRDLEKEANAESKVALDKARRLASKEAKEAKFLPAPVKPEKSKVNKEQDEKINMYFKLCDKARDEYYVFLDVMPEYVDSTFFSSKISVFHSTFIDAMIEVFEFIQQFPFVIKWDSYSSSTEELPPSFDSYINMLKEYFYEINGTSTSSSFPTTKKLFPILGNQLKLFELAITEPMRSEYVDKNTRQFLSKLVPIIVEQNVLEQQRKEQKRQEIRQRLALAQEKEKSDQLAVQTVPLEPAE